MSRKDYQLIADAIACTAARVKQLRYDAAATLDDLTSELSRRLASDNYRFNASTFRNACQLDGEACNAR